MAIRSRLAVTVVTRPTTSHEGSARSLPRVMRQSLPPLQETMMGVGMDGLYLAIAAPQHNVDIPAARLEAMKPSDWMPDFAHPWTRFALIIVIALAVAGLL